MVETYSGKELCSLLKIINIRGLMPTSYACKEKEIKIKVIKI